MENAFILFINIAVMFLYALPGFVLIKTKLAKPNAIAGLNVLLLFVCQPCLSYYALTKSNFETRILLNMLYVFLIALGVMLLIISVFFIFTRRKQENNVALRISNVSVAFGNCTFIGIPLLEALLPEYPEAVIYSIVFFISMSLIGWTVACFIITRDKKYISIKKILLNPATIGLIVALPFFITNYSLSSDFHGAITLVGRMSTPICMIILGMRLATLPLKSIFNDRLKYLSVAIRQLIVPLIYFLLCLILPIEQNLKMTLLICGATPIAAVVLNFAELTGEGQDYAAGSIILSNVLSIITMPLLILLFL